MVVGARKLQDMLRSNISKVVPLLEMPGLLSRRVWTCTATYFLVRRLVGQACSAWHVDLDVRDDGIRPRFVKAILKETTTFSTNRQNDHTPQLPNVVRKIAPTLAAGVAIRRPPWGPLWSISVCFESKNSCVADYRSATFAQDPTTSERK